MPLNLQKNLPAIELLKKEHIFVMDSLRAATQDIRPLRVVVLNLMPLKVTTETDLVRLLSNTPLQVEMDLMKIKGHTPKNTPIEHMRAFYKDFDQMKSEYYDGMIVTGAPVEQMPFEEVTYWEEIMEIFDWARTHVTSTLDEQHAIVDYIETRLTKIDNYIADLQAEIDYLKEFKQRLVSDVVTGQICVAEPQKGDLR